MLASCLGLGSRWVFPHFGLVLILCTVRCVTTLNGGPSADVRFRQKQQWVLGPLEPASFVERAQDGLAKDPKVTVKIIVRDSQGDTNVAMVNDRVPVSGALKAAEAQAKAVGGFPMYFRFYFDVGQEFCQNTGFCEKESKEKKKVRELEAKAHRQREKEEAKRRMAELKKEMAEGSKAVYQTADVTIALTGEELKEKDLCEQLGGAVPLRMPTFGGGDAGDGSRKEITTASVLNANAKLRAQLREVQEGIWKTWETSDQNFHRLYPAENQLKAVSKLYSRNSVKKSHLVPVPSIVYLHAFLEDVEFDFKPTDKDKKADQVVTIHTLTPNMMSNDDIVQEWKDVIRERMNLDEDDAEVKLTNKRGTEIVGATLADPKFAKKFLVMPSHHNKMRKKGRPVMFWSKHGEVADEEESEQEEKQSSDEMSVAKSEVKEAVVEKAAEAEKKDASDDGGGTMSMAFVVVVVVLIAALIGGVCYMMSGSEEAEARGGGGHGGHPPHHEYYGGGEQWQGEPKYQEPAANYYQPQGPDFGLDAPMGAAAGGGAITMMPTVYMGPAQQMGPMEPYPAGTGAVPLAGPVMTGTLYMPDTGGCSGALEHPTTYDPSPVIDLGYNGDRLPSQAPDSGAVW